MPCHGCESETMQEIMAELMPGAGESPLRHWLWNGLSEGCEASLLRVFKRWEGTPYMPGQQSRGMGVDCVHFVNAALSELYRVPSEKVPRKTSDCAIHSPRIGFETILFLRKRFRSDVVRNGTIQPGDIVITRASHSAFGAQNPGHVLIAGVQPFTAYHAVQMVGVRMTTLTAVNGILRVYRPKRKEQWASPQD